MAKGVFGLHFASVSVPRAERIAQGFAQIGQERQGRGEAQPRAMLDVGCGDGLLAKRTGELLQIEDVRGVDIKVQAHCRIPVHGYDGVTLPFPEQTFDIVTISDVLHHTSNPEQVLKELFRVTKPTGAVLVKDHFRLGPLSNAILLAMDVVGNHAQGIFVRGTYFSPSQWVAMVSAAGGAVTELVWPFQVHSLPWRAVTRSEFQFVAKLEPRGNPGA
jgi:2-polyprenyl-3-methyl-5-hydroxy-6-metoxy-1,4-benzoquinol methylase